MQNGETPLHLAALLGHTPIVALLLATPGVNPLAVDKGRRGCGAGPGAPRACFMPVSSFSASGGSTPLDNAENEGHATTAAMMRADPRVAAALAAAREACD